MKIFKQITEAEDFEDFKVKQFDDDKKVKEYFDNCNHKEFMSGIMHLGSFLDIVTTYLDFLNPQITEALELSGTKRDRKMNKYMRDLNERINGEYNFEKETVIIEQCILFEGELYLFFNKMQFIKMFELHNNII